VITITDETKKALSKNPDYELLKSFGPYSIFELTTYADQYVIVPKFVPVLFETSRWKEHSYLWFLNSDILDIPLVFTDDVTKNNERFDLVETDGELTDIPKIPIEKNCIIEEQVSAEEIKIKTSCIGVPHIVRVSHFPNWKVEGAERVYLVSPSFMLIVPTQEDVRLYFGKTIIDSAGVLLSILGLALVIFEGGVSSKIGKRFPKAKLISASENLDRYRTWILIIGIVVFFGVFMLLYNSQKASRIQDDGFGLELARATERYMICDVRIRDQTMKEACFKDVGIATNDYNLCDVKIRSPELRDECFKEIGIATNDLNLCLSKIASEELKSECIEKIR
jgi:hypothetical protein